MKKHLTIIAFLVISISLFADDPSILDDYLIIDAAVNGHLVKLALDTGAEFSCLFSSTTDRLGLKVTPPPEGIVVTPGKTLFSLSEPLTLSIANTQQTMTGIRLPVVQLPPAMSSSNTQVAGVIGWDQFKDCRLQLDIAGKHIAGLKQLPEDINTWTKFRIVKYPDFKVLLIDASDKTDHEEIIFIDTGNPLGIALNSQRWETFCQSNLDRPYTITAIYTPALGLTVNEIRWANELSIGNFKITNVIAEEEDAVLQQVFPNHQATLGSWALSRMDFIIDGPGGHVYTRPNLNPITDLNYNRIAAVFAPKDMASTPLLAHVVKNGPAYEAGIRDGDELIKINDMDVTKWQTDPDILPLSRFWKRPAGTTFKLTLLRDNKPLTISITLKEFFPASP